MFSGFLSRCVMLCEALGVPHNFTAVESPVPEFLELPGLLWFPQTVTVGHNPDAISSVGRIDAGKPE